MFIKSTRWLSDLLYAGVACSAGLIFGLSVAYGLSPYVFGILIAIFSAMLFLKRPEFAVVVLLVFTSTLFDDKANIGISIGFGHVYLTDMLLLGLLIWIVVRSITEWKFTLASTPLDLPIIVFVGLAFLSTFVAIFQSALTLQQSLGELRVVMSYLVFFGVTNLLRDEKRLLFLGRCIIGLASMVSIAMLFQYLFGKSFVFLPGRVETLQAEGVTFSGITRILPPGQSIVLVTFIVTTVMVILGSGKQTSAWVLLPWGLSGIATMLSFNRNFWIQAVLAILLIPFFIKGREWNRFLGFGIVVLVLVAVALLPMLLSPTSKTAELLNAATYRFTSLFSDKLLDESSLRWREVENKHALPQILLHPVLGLGMGARYRPYIPNLDYNAAVWDARTYIHNAHLWIILKVGLLGYLCLAWFSVVFLKRGFTHWRGIPNPEMRAYVLGFSLSYVGVLVAAIVNPILIQNYWTVLIGVMFGFNETVIRNMNDRDLIK